MKRIAGIGLVVCIVAFLTVGYVFAAEGHPSAKATAKLSADYLIDYTTDDAAWTTILSNTIKTANNKDLFIDVSLECGLYTRTLVRSKGGTKDTSNADAMIEVRVLIDTVAAAPGEVVFSRRLQQLSATLQGILDGAMTVDANDNVIIDYSLVTPEEIELIQETKTANSFNFVEDDLSSGVHTIEVQAKITFPAGTNTKQLGETEAKALVGKGSVTVEEVRLIKDEDIILE